MRRISILVAACATVAAIGFGAPGALAADKPSLADDVAARLGISVDQLRAAFKDALGARIDAAVAAGKLTPEQGAKLKERIASAKGLGIGLRKHFTKRHKAFARHIVARSRGLGAAAEYLGVTRPELRAQLRDGKSLAEIAVENGKTVDGLVEAILARAKERLGEAVSSARLTQQRADELLARLTERAEKLVQSEHAAAQD